MISDCNATGNLIHSFGFITCRQMIQRSKSLAPGPWPLSPPADPPDSTSAATGGFPNRTSTNSISTTANLSRSLQPLASASNCSSLCDFRRQQERCGGHRRWSSSGGRSCRSGEAESNCSYCNSRIWCRANRTLGTSMAWIECLANPCALILPL